MTASAEATKLASLAALAADRMKGEDVAVLDVSDPLVITDAFVLVSADNERLVSAIIDEIEDDLREAGAKPVRREGVREGRWALLDYGSVVIHVFREEERDYYGLDRLWSDCPRIEVEGLEQNVTEARRDAALSARSIDEIPLAAEAPDANEF
ncbi:ribosome silencing factor [Corynebacterium sp. H113]|uniref:ribosome silencing factor n=1 Tax=Corynebacterium sp. H113 TaxID=3133419 RepID=UPI0030996ADE